METVEEASVSESETLGSGLKHAPSFLCGLGQLPSFPGLYTDGKLGEGGRD